MSKHRLEHGFSLVETLVAITILLLVIIGPITISSQSARSTSFASEQVVAFFLAQEGVELVQKARDDLFNEHFVSAGDPWGEFTDDAGTYEYCYLADGCGLEISSETGADSGKLVAPGNCQLTGCPLYFNDASDEAVRSRYTHSEGGGSNVDTPYKRSIRLEYDSSEPHEVKVTSTVTWYSGNLRNEQSATVETYLFNTYGN